MPKSEWEGERDRWALLVGRFLLTFGDIELVAFILWPDYFPNDPPPPHFKERVSKLLGHLRKDPRMPSSVPDLFIEALKLANQRNTIAHHPLQVQVFQHSATGDLFSQLAISSELNDDYISDADLETLGVRAREVARSLYRSLWPNREAPGS